MRRAFSLLLSVLRRLRRSLTFKLQVYNGILSESTVSTSQVSLAACHRVLARSRPAPVLRLANRGYGHRFGGICCSRGFHVRVQPLDFWTIPQNMPSHPPVSACIPTLKVGKIPMHPSVRTVCTDRLIRHHPSLGMA